MKIFFLLEMTKSKLEKKILEINSLRNKPLFVLTTFGHNGVDWLHSLLDSHKDIVLMPAFSFFRTFQRFKIYIKSKNQSIFMSKKNLSISLTEYFTTHPAYKTKRRRFIFTNRQKNFFRKELEFSLKNLDEKNLTKKIFFSIHYAFCKIYKIKISNKKIIIVQEHVPWFCNDYKRIFKTKFIFVMRDPRAAFAGGILRMRNSNLDFKMNSLQFDRMLLYWFSAFQFFLKNKQLIKIMKNETMHKNLYREMKKLCNFLNIKYSNTCLKQTFLNQEWLGESAYLAKDELTEKYPKNFYKVSEVKKRWKSILDQKNTLILENILSKIFKSFKYKALNHHNLQDYFFSHLKILFLYQHQQKYFLSKYLIILRNVARRFLVLKFPFFAAKFFNFS